MEGVAAYESFLFLLGSIFVPLAGVFVADYFLLRRRGFAPEALFDPDGPYRYSGGVRVGAVTAWALGFVAFQWVFPTGPAWWTELVGRLPGAPLFGGGMSASVVSFGVAVVATLALLSRRRVPAGGR